MGITNDHKGEQEWAPALFKTFFAAGAKRYDDDARADGKGGFLRKGYYFKLSGGFRCADGPHSSRRVASARALEALRDHCEDELGDMVDVAA